MGDTERGFARLPAIERVVSDPAAAELFRCYARPAVVAAIRTVVDELRRGLKSGVPPRDHDFTVGSIVDRAGEVLRVDSQPRLRVVVNATGIVLHTNLGRALLAPSAVEAMVAAASAPAALEYDLDRGGRGERDRLVERHLCALTGAEAATVVNNNAAALLLVLNTLAQGREVIVSRGELIEIGGSFRIPDVMKKSGAHLCEVGTTNRTHRADYASAIGPRTAMLLKVHTSNYRIVGFTASVGLGDLRDLACEHADVTVVEDLGAGALVDLEKWGLPGEPVVSERLALGADLVTFSGDKLLGGPQCGLVVGRRDLVEALRLNPLKRAVRCDKSTLAALEATLRIYRFDPSPERTIPTLWALTRPLDELDALGGEAVELLRTALGDDHTIQLVSSEAKIGSGSQPDTSVPSRAVSITSSTSTSERLARRFREASPPIIGRIEHDRFLLDLRTVARATDLVPQPQ